MKIRAGVQGTAHTLVTENDLEFAGHIVRSLESANQEVPKELMDLALKSSWFSNSRYVCQLSKIRWIKSLCTRYKHGKGKGVGGTGLGFKERPAIGFEGGGRGGGGGSSIETNVAEQFRLVT